MKKGLNVLSLSVNIVLGICLLVVGTSYDAIVKRNYYLESENKSLMYEDSLARVENTKLQLINRSIDIDNYQLKNEIYKLKTKQK